MPSCLLRPQSYRRGASGHIEIRQADKFEMDEALGMQQVQPTRLAAQRVALSALRDFTSGA